MKPARLFLALLVSLPVLTLSARAADIDAPTAQDWETYRTKILFGVIYDRDHTPEEKITILETAAEKYKNTSLFASIQITAATYEHKTGKKDAAIARLQKITDDTRSIMLHLPYLPTNGISGIPPKRLIQLDIEFTRHLQAIPRMACDEALLQLRQWQIEDGNPQAAAQTAQKLLARYPTADHRKEDVAFLTLLRTKYPWFPPFFAAKDPTTDPLEDYVQYYEIISRPHAQLLHSIVQPDADPAKTGESTASTAMAGFLLLQQYDFLLSDDEIVLYAGDTQKLLATLKHADWTAPTSLEDAQSYLKKIQNAHSRAAKPRPPAAE